MPLVAALFLAGCSTLSQDLPPGPAMEDTPAQAPDACPAAVATFSDSSEPEPPAVVEDKTDTLSDIATTANHSAQRPEVLLDEALEFCQAAQEFWQKGDPDNALEALDQAYSLVLQADGNQHPKLAQQKDDLRYLISKRIMEIYASRNIVVNGQHRAIPLLRNAYVDAEIKSLTEGERDFFIASLKRSGRYRPRILHALHQAGLPEELSWLPLIESGFKVDALSRARALGLWQFIPSTGYKFGLKRDVYIDERLDPEKATEAAIAYLKELHSIFGDWTTVLAAYNCGEGRVLRIIRSQNVNYLDNFWDLYERLPPETARYVPRFLATLNILKDPKAYGLENIVRESPLAYETATVTRRVHLRDIATAIGTDEDTLRQLNPELRYRIVPGEDYPLKVTPGATEALLASLDQIPISSPVLSPPQKALPHQASINHRVRNGETLSSIARRYHTSVAALTATNKLRRGQRIIAGRSLKIPIKGVAAAWKTTARRTAPASSTTRHVVRSGDSLWILARRYGTTVPKILAANNLTGPNLDIGQSLIIPTGSQAVEAPAKHRVYNVQKGDTPFMIAKKFKMPLESLLRINQLTPRCTIYPGQSLQVD